MLTFVKTGPHACHLEEQTSLGETSRVKTHLEVHTQLVEVQH